MSDYISKSEMIYKIRGVVPSSQDVDFIVRLIEEQPTVSETEIIRKAFERVVEQLNGLMPIQFNGFGKTLITIEDVIKILKEECGIE